MSWQRCCVLVLGFSLVGGMGCKREEADPASSDTTAARTAEATAPAETADVKQDQETVIPAAETVDHARGKAAWAAGMCAKCHTDSAKGGPRAPDLTDDKWLHCDGSVAGIRGVLVSGVPRKQLSDPNRPFPMNPVSKLVPDAQDLDALAAYVHSLSK